MLSTALSTLNFARHVRFMTGTFGSMVGAALVVSACVGLLFTPLTTVQADDTKIIKITMGKAEVVPVMGAVADIMVADPKIADVSALQSNKLYIVGASIGDTNIIALDSEGNVVQKLDVHVRIDTDIIEDMIHTVFPSEKNVMVHTVGNQVALTGTVSNPSTAQKIAKLVAAHMGEVRKSSAANVDEMIENLMEVRGEQQVTLRVRIMEVSRDILKELGVESSANDLNETSATNVFGHKPVTSTNSMEGFVGVNSNTGLTKDPFGITSLIFDSGINGIGDIEFLLNALESDNLANVLAEPNLTAVSGEKAGFLAGGEFPVPVGRDQDGNIVIDYKQFGVSLNFKPVVMSEDRISLQLDTEVSSLDQGNGLTLSDIQIPGLDVRRASTTVEINSGGSLMLAGLLKSENTKGMSGIPGIKDTPVLGDLISSKSFQRQETELVVIVTPYLVQPFADRSTVKPVFQSQKNLPPPPPTAMMNGDKGKPAPLYDEKTAQDIAAAEVDTPVIPLDTAPMTKVFQKNMRRIYGDRMKNVPKSQAFGYMID